MLRPYAADSYVNMSNIALLEVPADRWHRLNAPEEREDNDDDGDDGGMDDDEADPDFRPVAPTANDNRLGVVAGVVSEADRIRMLVERDYFAPARAAGTKVIEITAREIHDIMGYQARFPVVCNALGGRRIEERCSVAIVHRKGPAASSSTVFRYKLA